MSNRRSEFRKVLSIAFDESDSETRKIRTGSSEQPKVCTKLPKQPFFKMTDRREKTITNKLSMAITR